jgi:membrane associated rhomboid family serine protease
VPLSDRDYMKPSPPPKKEYRRFRSDGGFGLNPVLAIIIANLIFLVAVLVSGEGTYRFGEYGQVTSDRFTYYLGLIPYYFTSRPWTIFTDMFIHAGIWHLLGNMITLYFFGMFLSRLVGHGKFLLVYFVGGVVGNALYLLLAPSLSIAIGASGAIYAIAGALVVMMPTMRVAIWGILPLPLWLVILLFFVLWSLPNVVPGIAWQAHIGGLVTGLIAGFFFRRRTRYVY